MEQIQNWVVQINDELKGHDGPSSEKVQYWKRPSIYKISSRITELNKNAYAPQAVSFGPYHHGKDHLKAMEEHKERALLHFLKMCDKPADLVFQRMERVVQELKDSYKPLDPIWDQDTLRFLQLMILDGCFMLEIIRASHRYAEVKKKKRASHRDYAEEKKEEAAHCDPRDYAKNDPVFSKHGQLNVMPYVKRDMLMLENQLPMLALHTLIEVESDETQGYDLLNKQILEFLSLTTAETQTMDKKEMDTMDKKETVDKCVHVLDLYRKNLIQGGPSHRTCSCMSGYFGRFLGKKESKHDVTGEIIRSATELHEAGIGFKKSKSQSLRDITFCCGILKLPIMVVDDTTESKLLNIITFERLHVGAGNEVTSYVYFMNTIIDDENDVALLHRRGILVKALGCHNDIAMLFNSLAKDITPDQQRESDMAQITAKLSKYCKKSFRRWRATLSHTYCRNPWVATSVVAAIFLFALTIIQTGYSIAGYYDQHYKGGGGS